MLDKLAAGDVVTVTRIDRLARSTFDLFGIVNRIVDAKALFRSLAEPWADIGTSTGAPDARCSPFSADWSMLNAI
jgi:DNA invertase Pin-like site-specific DNA recombinase